MMLNTNRGGTTSTQRYKNIVNDIESFIMDHVDEENKNGLTILLDLMRQVATVETNYSSFYKSGALESGTIDELGTIKNGFDLFLGNFSNKAAQHLGFASNILQEIIKPMEIMEKDYLDKMSLCLQEVQQLDRKLDDLLKNLSNESSRYDRAKKQSQFAIKALEDLKSSTSNSLTDTSTDPSKMNLNKADKFFKKIFGKAHEKILLFEETVAENEKEGEDILQQYHKAYNNYVSAEAEQENMLVNIYNKLKEIEIEKNETIKDNLRKFVIFESSVVANVQYDLQKLMPGLENIDSAFDAAELFDSKISQIKALKDSTPFSVPLPPPPLKVIEKKVEKKDSEMVKRKSLRVSSSDDVEAFEIMCANTLNHLSLEGVTVHAAMIDRLLATVKKHPYGSSILLSCMKSQRGQGSGNVILSDSSFEQVGILLNGLLDVASETNDYVSVKTVMLISLTFEKSSLMKESVQVLLRDHPVWQNLEYWNSILFDAIGVEMAKNEKAEKDVAFSQLVFFAFNMAKFNIKKDTIISTIRKYAALIELDDLKFEEFKLQLDEHFFPSLPIESFLSAEADVEEKDTIVNSNI